MASKPPKPDWFQLVFSVSQYVVKIETPGGHGSGFLCFYGGAGGEICGIATAHHVIQHANDWQEPLRLIHGPTAAAAFFNPSERAFLVNPANDSAIIIIPKGKLKLPEELLPLLEADRFVYPGVELGWIGFPAVAPQSLCFFSGSVSAKLGEGYLIDGVAINGVSGGPVFFIDTRNNSLTIMGAITQYLPNVATGNMLPGLSFAQSVAHFHSIIEV
ncbi:MAG TPA: hypothetical protein VGF86_12505 [Candidatus Tumulicola sp.]